MKGQSNILEYALLVFFILVIIFVMIIFLTGFQVFQIDADLQKQTLDRALLLSKQFMSSEFFTAKNSMFDGARVVSASSMCSDLEKRYGSGWFMEVNKLGSGPTIICTEDTYPECNNWKLCTNGQRNISYVFPVNILDKVDGTVYLGTLRVGVYI